LEGMIDFASNPGLGQRALVGKVIEESGLGDLARSSDLRKMCRSNSLATKNDDGLSKDVFLGLSPLTLSQA